MELTTSCSSVTSGIIYQPVFDTATSTEVLSLHVQVLEARVDLEHQQVVVEQGHVQLELADAQAPTADHALRLEYLVVHERSPHIEQMHGMYRQRNL